MTRMEIRLLGPPQVIVGDRPLEVDTRKAIAILALLATDRRAYARDELAALLWPESEDVAARGALRRTLSTMRAAIGDGPLIVDRARVDLDRAEVVVDLEVIEAAARDGDRVALAAAADVARGEFLAGFTLRDSPEFDDWRASRSVAVERAVLTVLDRLAVAAEADGDLPTAIRAIERRLEVDPLDESAHVRLMDLLLARGDRGGALRQYRRCVATLDRELGVAPLASTTARYEAIRDLASDAIPSPASDTPSAPIARTPERPRLPLVDRSDELAVAVAAHDAVAQGSGAILVVRGEAGIGKTRLLDAVEERLSERGAAVLGVTGYPTERSIAYGPIVDLLRAALDRPDGRDRLARLDGTTRAELARLLPAIDPSRAGEVRSGGPGAHARLVGAIVEGLTGLVAGSVPGVLRIDDAQWLDPATRKVLDALVNRLDRYPVLLLLAWRPEDLDPDGAAFAARVADRPASAVVALDRFGRAAVEALVTAATPDAATPDRIDRIAAASEGLPLYVVSVLGTDGAEEPEALPPGVRSVLRARLTSIDETTTQVLAAASVIGRSFDLETVRYASGRSEEETVDALDEALRRGLIRDAPGGYDFTHGAIRDLVDESTSLTRRRLLHRRAADALRIDLARSGRDDPGRLVLVAVHERAAGRDAEAAEAYVIAGRRAAGVYANHAAIEHLSAALALGHSDAAGLHEEIGRLRTRLGDYPGAIEALEAGAALAGTDKVRLASLEWGLARVHLRRGDLVAAEHHLAAAADASSEPRLIGGIAVDRSVLDRRRNDPVGAARWAREALALARQVDDPVVNGAAHRMLGLAALDSGDTDRAVAELSTAVSAAASDPDPTSYIAALVGLALATSAAGDVDRALHHGEAALDTCRRIGDVHLEAAVEDHLADLLHAAGREAEAREHQRRAVAAFAGLSGDAADPDPGIWMLAAW